MIRRTTIWLALAAAALALGACGEKAEPELGTQTTSADGFEITGEWRGRLTQAKIKPFPIETRIGSLERSKENTVRYGGEIDCAGTWDYLGASDTAYRFRETIDSGAGGRCRGTGTVSLTPLAQNAVRYEFSGGGVTSRGQLGRVVSGGG